MVRDPLSLLDALLVALLGFVIAFIMLAVLWGIIVVISRAMTGAEQHPVASSAPVSTPAPITYAAHAAPPSMAAPPAASQTVLMGITDTEAACVMAIISHETGIALDQLVFRSIKAVEGGTQS
nr:hypothetical protein [uncultured Agathobaculum sp.]